MLRNNLWIIYLEKKRFAPAYWIFLFHYSVTRDAYLLHLVPPNIFNYFGLGHLRPTIFLKLTHLSAMKIGLMLLTRCMS